MTMTRKGRRGRAGRASSVAPQEGAGEQQVVEASEPEVPEQVIAASEPEELQAPPEPEVPYTVPRDDSSYPPVDLDNHFFEGQTHSRSSYPPSAAEERDPRMALKLTPEVARRRADLSRYVKFAVAAASALCLAALVKVAVAHNSTESGTTRPTMAAAVAAPPVQAAVQAAAATVARRPAARLTAALAAQHLYLAVSATAPPPAAAAAAPPLPPRAAMAHAGKFC